MAQNTKSKNISVWVNAGESKIVLNRKDGVEWSRPLFFNAPNGVREKIAIWLGKVLTDENGKPVASSHVVDFQRLSGEILAYSGTPAPSQLKPFTYDGAYWSIGNLTLNYATEGLRSYNVEIVKLAGTAAADFTETA